MKFQQLVEEILQETTVIGGITSCMGPSVSNTASPFSGDNWNTGDNRIAKSLYGGTLTRQGIKGKKGKKKTKKKE